MALLSQSLIHFVYGEVETEVLALVGQRLTEGHALRYQSGFHGFVLVQHKYNFHNMSAPIMTIFPPTLSSVSLRVEWQRKEVKNYCQQINPFNLCIQ